MNKSQQANLLLLKVITYLLGSIWSRRVALWPQNRRRVGLRWRPWRGWLLGLRPSTEPSLSLRARFGRWRRKRSCSGVVRRLGGICQLTFFIEQEREFGLEWGRWENGAINQMFWVWIWIRHFEGTWNLILYMLTY